MFNGPRADRRFEKRPRKKKVYDTWLCRYCWEEYTRVIGKYCDKCKDAAYRRTDSNRARRYWRKEENKERRAEAQSEYWASEKGKETKRNYYQRNKEAVKERVRKRREENKEPIPDRPCKKCGLTFTPTFKNGVNCKECSLKKKFKNLDTFIKLDPVDRIVNKEGTITKDEICVRNGSVIYKQYNQMRERFYPKANKTYYVWVKEKKKYFVFWDSGSEQVWV